MNVSNGLANHPARMRVLTQGKQESPLLAQRSRLRCGKAWWPRSQTKPKRCPRCKNPYWDRPRRIKEARPPGTKEELRKYLQGRLRKEAGIDLADKPRQDRSLVKALLVLKEMKNSGLTWQQMGDRLEREFGAKLDKEQLKALVR